MNNIRYLLPFAAACFAAAQPAAPARTAVPGRSPAKIQVLVLTGYNMHSWRKMTAELVGILERTGKFEVRVNEEPAGITEPTFEGYDVVVLNYTNFMLQFGPAWPDSTRRAVLGFLERGKGLVAYHGALSSFTEWPEYEKVIGGAWRKSADHAPYHTFKVEMADSAHPIIRGFPPFEQSDELFQRLLMQPDVHILARAYDDPANCTKGKRPSCGSGRPEPIMWALEYGKGRVFTTTLGHDMQSITSPGFVGTFQRGVEWAATGMVTIPVPAELAGKN